MAACFRARASSQERAEDEEWCLVRGSHDSQGSLTTMVKDRGVQTSARSRGGAGDNSPTAHTPTRPRSSSSSSSSFKHKNRMAGGGRTRAANQRKDEAEAEEESCVSGRGDEEGAEEEEDLLDLMYDPYMNCYYDPRSKKYYQLK